MDTVRKDTMTTPPRSCAVCEEIATLIQQACGLRSNHLPSDVASLIRVLHALKRDACARESSHNDDLPSVYRSGGPS